MNGINSFIIGFCGSCVLLGFLYMLCPSGSMSVSVKYIFGLCFACCVLASALSMPKPDFSFLNETKSSEILTEENAAVTAQMVFSEALRQQNINFRKITVDTYKLIDGSITIDKVTVYTSEDASKIMQAIGSDNYEVSIVNE